MSPTIVLLQAVALSFLRAFVGVFATLSVIPIADLSQMKILAIAAVGAGAAAAFRTAQALMTNVTPTDKAVN